MDIKDILSIVVVNFLSIGLVNTVFGHWVKTRIEGSIKYEYDKAFEKVKSEWKRTDILLAERIVVFKAIQKKLLSIRRYCASQINSENGSEFGSQPDDLETADNKSILTYWTELEILLDENLIFFSSPCRASFERLFGQFSLGANMELWLISSEPLTEIVTSKADGYQEIINRINECIEALFKDLQFDNRI